MPTQPLSYFAYSDITINGKLAYSLRFKGVCSAKSKISFLARPKIAIVGDSVSLPLE